MCPRSLAIYHSRVAGAIRFASNFEAKVYKELKILGLEVYCQAKLPLVRLSEKSRDKKPLEWKIDFMAWQRGTNLHVPVEAKGGWITHNHGAKEAFCKTLRMLEYSDPASAKNLIIVSPGQSIKIDEVHTTVSFKDFRQVISQKFNLI